MAQIILNGQPRDLGPSKTVRALLADLELAETQVAVERNREIVPRALYAETALENGDKLEVVTFVGGG